MTAFENIIPLPRRRRRRCVINKFAPAYVYARAVHVRALLKLLGIGRNKFIFHASIALWLLLIENTERFPTSLGRTQRARRTKKCNYVTNPAEVCPVPPTPPLNMFGI